MVCSTHEVLDRWLYIGGFRTSLVPTLPRKELKVWEPWEQAGCLCPYYIPLHVDRYEMNYLILLQPTLNPRGSLWCDIVWMKKWGVGRRRLPVGSIVALRSGTFNITRNTVSCRRLSPVQVPHRAWQLHDKESRSD